jgi:hypothetical protein
MIDRDLFCVFLADVAKNGMRDEIWADAIARRYADPDVERAKADLVAAALDNDGWMHNPEGARFMALELLVQLRTPA